MNHRFDFKSMAIGVLVGLGAFFAVGATEGQRETQPVGRFQITAGQTTAFVLDTKTGQVWSNNQFSPSGLNDGLPHSMEDARAMFFGQKAH
jgi:hypothetical protein